MAGRGSEDVAAVGVVAQQRFLLRVGKYVAELGIEASRRQRDGLTPEILEPAVGAELDAASCRDGLTCRGVLRAIAKRRELQVDQSEQPRVQPEAGRVDVLGHAAFQARARRVAQ